jgi:uncharacterized protein YceH (UPF0502 family)
MSAIFVALIKIRARRPGKNRDRYHKLFKGPADSEGCSKDPLVARWFMKSRRPVGG